MDRVDRILKTYPGLAQLFTAQEGRTMQLSKQKLAMVIAFTIIGIGAARGQDAIDRLHPLVETSARRLFIAEQVALAKWDSGAAVEDLPREAQVVRDAVRDGNSRGLDPTSISKFFKAQIEANKIIQYSLLADWRRSGRAPAHAPIDLVATQTGLIAELADTMVIHASTTCRADVAKAIGKYIFSGPLSICWALWTNAVG